LAAMKKGDDVVALFLCEMIQERLAAANLDHRDYKPLLLNARMHR
jgi:hypothetical protein